MGDVSPLFVFLLIGQSEGGCAFPVIAAAPTGGERCLRAERSNPEPHRLKPPRNDEIKILSCRA